MIDINFLREHQERATDLITRKEPSFDSTVLLSLDAQLRVAKTTIESLRKERNDLAAAGAKGVTDELRARASEIGKQIKDHEAQIVDIEAQFKKLILSCPNIPQEDVPLGNKEANAMVREFGAQRNFTFAPKNHVELNQKLNWFDTEVAARMSGAQFVFYHEQGTKLLYALTRLMLKNNAQRGFAPVMPPYLVQDHALVNSGNLPKFEGDFYSIPADGLNLIPTAEVSLTNLYADQILPAADLPMRKTAWTSCFRREAGGYGSQERGLIRIHQFEKVELYSICEPEKSNDELEYMVDTAEQLLKILGLHYRVMLLAAQDCSFASARTYDIEVWLPGQNRYYEVSSCSNCTDFQARRAAIRYRQNAESKPRLAHTLNASALALPRLMVALMENYQQEDGSIALPDVLKNAMNELW